VVLTGTPIENNTRELWSLFDFLCPGMLGNQRFFKENYDNGAERDLGKIGPRELARQVRPFILRRTKSEVFQQLPPKLEQTVFCELTEGQRRIYQQIHEEASAVLETVTDGSIQESRFELLALLLRMRQLCCHPALLPKEFTQSEAEELNSAKLALFREELQECLDDNHRVLVFSQFRSMLQLMIPVLNDLGINYEYLDGNTKDRQARVDRFNQDDTLPVFLISLKAGGTGLNLTGADTVIHYDQWWNPMVEDQATDRTHRIGQKNVVTSMKLITKNTIEERILELQGQKRELFDQLIGAAPGKLDALSNEDLAFLLTNY
jgi:SNF2 family DNA or RNA helicase